VRMENFECPDFPSFFFLSNRNKDFQELKRPRIKKKRYHRGGPSLLINKFVEFFYFSSFHFSFLADIRCKDGELNVIIFAPFLLFSIAAFLPYLGIPCDISCSDE
jgi:hypothetical protein